MKTVIQYYFEDIMEKSEDDFFTVKMIDGVEVGDCIEKGKPFDNGSFEPINIGVGNYIIISDEVMTGEEYQTAMKPSLGNMFVISKEVIQSKNFNNKIFRFIRNEFLNHESHGKIHCSIMEYIG